jgi:hypothetical protein
MVASPTNKSIPSTENAGEHTENREKNREREREQVCQGWLKQLRNLEQLCTSFCGQEETVQQPNSRETFSLNVN